jgi:hypothetical protein
MSTLANKRGDLGGFVYGSLPYSPIVDGLLDGLWSKITALHFVVWDSAQRLSHVLLSDLVSLIHVLAQNHFRGDGGASDGHRTPHAFELHILDDFVFNPQGDQDRIAVYRASDDRPAGKVGDAARVFRVSIVSANLFVVQS